MVIENLSGIESTPEEKIEMLQRLVISLTREKEVLINHVQSLARENSLLRKDSCQRTPHFVNLQNELSMLLREGLQGC
jgi:hypothetical protein